MLCYSTCFFLKNIVFICYIMTWTTAALFNNMGKTHWFFWFLLWGELLKSSSSATLHSGVIYLFRMNCWRIVKNWIFAASFFSLLEQFFKQSLTYRCATNKKKLFSELDAIKKRKVLPQVYFPSSSFFQVLLLFICIMEKKEKAP